MYTHTTGISNVHHGSNPSIGPEPLLLRGGEVAKLLGISRALAFRWMQTGILPTMRVPGSRCVRVPKAALLRFIDERTREGVQA